MRGRKKEALRPEVVEILAVSKGAFREIYKYSMLE